MAFHFGGLKERILKGAPKPQRDYGAEIDTSLDKAAIKTAYNYLGRVLYMVEAGQPYERLHELIWDAYNTLDERRV